MKQGHKVIPSQINKRKGYFQSQVGCVLELCYFLINIYNLYRMSKQAVVPILLNGEQLFTHTSWFSQKQYNSWSNIPIENHNLAFYYGATTLAVAAILLRKTTAVKSVFTSLGKTVLGISGGIVGGYIGWYGVLKSQEGSEIYRVVLKNECGTTPLWKSEDSVVNLREKDYKTFMSRRQGRVYSVKDVKAYNPEKVLLGSKQNYKIQQLA